MREIKKIVWDRWQLLCVVLALCLVISLSFNVVQYFGSEHSPKTFVFTWVWKHEYRMELTFDTAPTLSGANLSITAKINEGQYHYRDSLNLLFDKDGDGEFEFGDPAFILYVDNTTHYGFLDEEWVIAYPKCVPQPSAYHTCTFDESGYTFRISFPLEELNLKNDLIYVVYSSFYKVFHFDPEGELFK